MNSIQLVAKGANLPSLWMGVSSVLIGIAAAALHGNFELFPAMVCLIFVVFAQLCSNLVHRYFYQKNGYGDQFDDNLTRAEDTNYPIEHTLAEGAKTAGLLALTSGLCILGMAGWWTLIPAIFIIAVLYFSNAGPKPLTLSTYFTAVTFFVFGPFAVITTEMVQSQRGADSLFNMWDLGPAIYLGIVAGLMAMNCHFCYGVVTREQDRRTGRRTIAVRFGTKVSATITAISSLVYAPIAAAVPYLAGISKWWIYAPVPALSLIFSLYTSAIMCQPGKDLKCRKYSMANFFLFAVATLIFMFIIGFPHGSTQIR